MKQMYALVILAVVIILGLWGISKLMQEKNGSIETAATIGYSTSTIIINNATTSTSSQTMNNTNDATAETKTVVLHTNKGDVTLELLTTTAPITAGNFVKLAQEKFYDGTKFHRVIDGFMIQGGDPLSKDEAQSARWGTGGPGYAIQDEFVAGLSNTRGTISMANSGPNTGGSQFFINTANNTFLDGKHAVFGKVIAGMDVVDAIGKTKTGAGDKPVEAVVIQTVEVK